MYVQKIVCLTLVQKLVNVWMVCIIGFYGDTCNNRCLQTCANLTCDRKLGTCKQTYNDAQVAPKEADPELSLEGIIGISIGAVVVVIIFVIVIVCCINYKRRYDDAKTEIHLPSDVIERLSTHRSLHSTTSTNYPVARVVGDDNEKDFVLF
ncbi:uncharacterized protein LOC132742128 [Ruditapes philippinarum]|uniref:uncharacterized protein LOC132742128 n=1 Tax=Ruditapes philippinarum TaxID=129788 RepID=UPI00295B3918|nr:uncharacterized protein LOC132742128 [Ruditapes philippinarum]